MRLFTLKKTLSHFSSIPMNTAIGLSIILSDKRLLSTQAKAPAQARQMNRGLAPHYIKDQPPAIYAFQQPSYFSLKSSRPLFFEDFSTISTKKGSFKVSMLSPGIIYEPYASREQLSFWRRWFTRSGWKRTKEDVILELKSAYAIAKLRKTGYSKLKFYKEAFELYKEINTQMANGDKASLRKAVTEKMYSALKNEIKQRESMWSAVYWELLEPAVKIRTLRARLIGVDRDDLSKVFIQLTLEFLTKQKFEAYDSKGAAVAGDKNKEILVRDIWVFEKSMFHTGAYWRLCGRIQLKPVP
ncbi:hypothetical protein LguiB_024238 [Lonicera macranthoides]